MGKKYHKHIILMLAFWVGNVTIGFSQKIDSAAAAVDTVAQQTATDSSPASETDNDTLQNGLNKFILKDSTPLVAERKITQADIKQIANDKDFWYANKPMPGNEQVLHNPWLATVINMVFWALVGAFAIGIVLLCIRVFANTGKKRYLREIHAVDNAENIFATDFDDRIASALAEKDYRLGTRLLFLRLLRNMADKNIIAYRMEKTNVDYLFELGGSKYFNNFSAIVRGYEYVWYGNFNIQQSQFMLLRQRLDELTHQINN